MEKNKKRDSPIDRRYEVCVGPMQEDEKQYLLQKGLLFEDSRGECFEKSTLLDDTMESLNEDDRENARKPDNRSVDVLFHIGDICVGPPMPPGSILPDNENGIKSEKPLISSNVSEGNIDSDSYLNEDECIKENIPPVFAYVNTGIGIDMKDDALDEYSTPENSYCQVSPPIVSFETPPALNPESQNSSDYYEEALSGSELESDQMLKRASVSGSGEDLDDTLSQMEKLLALADEQERKELEIANDTGTLKEIKPILNKTSSGQSLQMSEDTGVLFKTPYAPSSSKMGTQSSKRVNYASPLETDALLKPAGVTSRAVSSTPKSATHRTINSLMVSPVSTIRGSPTPHTGRLAIPQPVRWIPIPVQKKTSGPLSGTPARLPEKRPGKVSNLMPMPVNSPVAQYIYSTPTPAMVKRAVKTESGPQDKKPWRFQKVGVPVPKSGAGSGIPRLQSLSNSTSKNVCILSDSMHNEKLTALNEGLGKKAFLGKQLKTVAYQGSTPSSKERVFGNDADDFVSTPVSTPVVDVASKSEPFIAQRHTGLRNVNTNESIVQHSSVDKKFIPVRIFGTKK